MTNSLGNAGRGIGIPVWTPVPRRDANQLSEIGSSSDSPWCATALYS